MSSKEPTLVFVANYDNMDDAKLDYQAVKELHKTGVVGTYDAALITRDEKGTVHITETEKQTEHSAVAGLATGAIVGGVAAAVAGAFILPILLVGAAMGAIGGGLIGHMRESLPHKDLKEIGDGLQNSTASVVVVAESKLDQALKNMLTRAAKKLEKQIDLDAGKIDRALNEAVSTANRR